MKLTTLEREDFKNLTSGLRNFNLVIVDKSDAYPAAHFRLAILMSLAASMGLYFFPWSFADPIWYLYSQVPALILGYLLASRKIFKRFFSTSSELQEESYQKALEYYYENNLKGELLFISLLEKKVHLINANDELEDKDGDKEKRKSISELSKNIKKIGLKSAIENYLSTKKITSTFAQEPVVSLDPVKEVTQINSQTISDENTDSKES